MSRSKHTKSFVVAELEDVPLKGKDLLNGNEVVEYVVQIYGIVLHEVVGYSG